MVYTANWGIICYLPPFRGTRNNHWIIRSNCHLDARSLKSLLWTIVGFIKGHHRSSHPRKITKVPWKETIVNGHFIFQPSVFRGYVIVWTYYWWKNSCTTNISGISLWYRPKCESMGWDTLPETNSSLLKNGGLETTFLLVPGLFSGANC